MEVKQTFIDFLQVIPDGALVIDRKGVIVAVNQAAAMMFRYSSSSMLELHLNNLLPDDVREKHDQYLQKFFKHPARRSMGNGLIFPAIRCDGSTFHVDIMLNQLELEGELYGIAIVRDYTLQKRAEDKIRLELEFEKRQALTDHLTGIMNRRAFTAQLMMQRLRSQLVSGIGHAELPVTLSIGLCQCDKPSELYTIEGIMARADKAMYQAKKEGKNAVVLTN